MNMLVVDEYMRRHGLKIPVARHSLTSGSLLIKTDPLKSGFMSRWVVVNVTWRDPGNHPGHYDVKVMIPCRDSHNKRDMFQAANGYGPVLPVKYEEYSQFFTRFAQTPCMRAIVDRCDTLMASWEIFLYCYDSFLAEKSSVKLRDAIDRSLDDSIDRTSAYNQAISCLIREQYAAFEKYDLCVHSHVRRPLLWLADLINGDQ